MAPSHRSPDQSAGVDLAWGAALPEEQLQRYRWTETARQPNGAGTAGSCGSAGTERGREEVWFKLCSNQHIEPDLGPPRPTQRWTFLGSKAKPGRNKLGCMVTLAVPRRPCGHVVWRCALSFC